MSVLNSIFSWIITKRIHQIELFLKHPHKVQSDVFYKLMAGGQHTLFGNEHKFYEISSYQEFKNRVPLQDYESLKPYIELNKKGQQNVLWKGEVRWFAKSSGTTSEKSKFIPVSKEAIEDCHFKGGKDMLGIYYHNVPNSKIFEGKSLVVGGSTEVNQFSNKSYYGDLSAIIIKNLPFWVEYKRTPGVEVALMDEWEEKINKMAKITSNENVTNLAGVPSWTLLLIHKILELKKAKHIHEVWPNLELYMHGGVNFSPYESSFNDIINSKSKLNLIETYNASEGFFGIQDRIEAKDMLLMLDYGIYYEFIPFFKSSDDEPLTITLDQVQLHKTYEMVISTNAGLWRYRIGDTIRFTSLLPYRVQVVGRTKHYINVFGEELMVHNTDQAIGLACKEMKVKIKEYTVAPKMYGKGNGVHEWVIEFEGRKVNKQAFIVKVDEALQKLNSDYTAKRHKNMILDSPIIHVVPENTFYNWMKSRGKLGGQNKVPRLSMERKYLEELLRFIN